MSWTKAFLVLLALAALGVASLLLTADLLLANLPQEARDLAGGERALRILLLVQPLVLSAVAIAAGLLTAHRVGLRSRIVDRVRRAAPATDSSPFVVYSTIAGIVAGTLIVLGDRMFAPWTAAALAPATVAQGPPLPALLTGMLYGGLTEELLVRWGLMSLLAWGLHRIGLPRRRAIGAALAVAALAFGLGHLPALAQLADPTPLLVLRTVFLNALGGLVFGWLYAVRGLEAAMVAHAASHLVFFGARLAGIGV